MELKYDIDNPYIHQTYFDLVNEAVHYCWYEACYMKPEFNFPSPSMWFETMD